MAAKQTVKSSGKVPKASQPSSRKVPKALQTSEKRQLGRGKVLKALQAGKKEQLSSGKVLKALRAGEKKQLGGKRLKASRAGQRAPEREFTIPVKLGKDMYGRQLFSVGDAKVYQLVDGKILIKKGNKQRVFNTVGEAMKWLLGGKN